MTAVNERLKALQITLPEAPPVVDGCVAAFVPFVRTGNLVYLSGRLPPVQWYAPSWRTIGRRPVASAWDT